jgi:hypothetical protein
VKRVTWYIVIFSKGRWWIDCEGKPYGPFDNEADAIAEGPKFITLMGNPDHRNDLYVRDDDGRYRVVWSSEDKTASDELPE